MNVSGSHKSIDKGHFVKIFSKNMVIYMEILQIGGEK